MFVRRKHIFFIEVEFHGHRDIREECRLCPAIFGDRKKAFFFLPTQYYLLFPNFEYINKFMYIWHRMGMGLTLTL